MTEDPSRPDRTASPPARPRRWIYPLLFVSLAVNLLIVGMVAGWMISPNRAERADRLDRSVRSVMGEPFLRALPEEHRRALVRDVLSEGARLRENRAALRARFEALLAALRAEPFDPAAVRDLFAQQREVALKRQRVGEDLLLKRLSEMSAAERAAYADRLARALRRLRRD